MGLAAKPVSLLTVCRIDFISFHFILFYFIAFKFLLHHLKIIMTSTNDAN